MSISNYTSYKLPLILPDGIPETEFSDEEDYDCEILGEETERISKSLEIIVLNKYSPGIEERIEINNLDDGQSVPKCESNAEIFVRSVLLDLIEELKRTCGYNINQNEVAELRSNPKICYILKKTSLLKNIEINRLETMEETTCFLINLTNLMWIHALLFTARECKNGLLFKNWALRHLYFNFIGYKIGSLGFVTLYDLHSTLLNYPSDLRFKNLDSLKFLMDSRIYFTIAQPYIFSPKIHVANPSNLDSFFENSCLEYLTNIRLLIDIRKDLVLPIPLLLQIEKVIYDENFDGKICNDDSLEEKFSWLIGILKEKQDFPSFKNDIFILNKTQFSINFSYCVLMHEEYSSSKTSWIWCSFHKSLYHCLVHHVNLIRSIVSNNNHAFFLRHSAQEVGDRIYLNNVLYKMGNLFYVLMRKIDYKTIINYKGIRCLYSTVSFVIGGPSGICLCNNGHNKEFYHFFEIIKNTDLDVPDANICPKITICIKIIMNIKNMKTSWANWYALYIADPNSVLNDIVEHEISALAVEWLEAQKIFDAEWVFSTETYGKLLAFLCDSGDESLVNRAIKCISSVSSFSEMFDYLIGIQYPFYKLTNLALDVTHEKNLSETEKVTVYSLLIGLKMISFLSEEEQTFFHDVVGSPVLIVEQLILNKNTDALKIVLKEVNLFVSTFSDDVKKVEAALKNEIDELLISYAEKSLHFCKEVPRVHCKYAAMLHAVLLKDGNFHPPDKIPSVSDWVPNDWAPHCMCCSNKFSVFVRRHHCRRCGRLVCAWCSTKKWKLSTYRDKVRICDQCFSFENQYENSDESCSQSSSSVSIYDKVRKLEWILSRDSSVNEYIRNQAIFDTAPDIELCLSILELHSENIAVPRFLFLKAEDMLKILRQRLICPANFDYTEVTRIVRYLLSTAKIYYSHFGETQGARRCEELTNEVDILNRVAQIGFSPPDAGKPMRNVPELRKLRDVLLEQQNWELALEISTKIGSSDCSGIWYLWGKNTLKSGDWASARDKFSRSNLKKNSNLLPDVLEIFYANAGKEMPTRFPSIFKYYTKKSILPDAVYNECLYYLKTYGNSEQLFHFYVRNDRIVEAMKVTFCNKISPKLFLEHIYIPHIENNNYTKINKWMETLDSSLIGWQTYIHEICVYCSKNNHFKVLYEIQLWMKDYFRAAISCTMFYKTNAKTYAQLAKNGEYLLTAVTHFETCLKQKKTNDLMKNVETSDISKYINTIHLQIEITKSICANNECANRKFQPVPTLFDRKSEKLDLICFIFDALDDVSSAFSLSHRLIREFSLDTNDVFGRVAVNLVRKNQENSVTVLVECIMDATTESQSIIDGLIVAVIKAKPQKPEIFLNYITEISTKIDMLIEAEWLKSAYILAVKHNRLEDIRKVLNAAKRLKMHTIEEICIKKLNLKGNSEKNSVKCDVRKIT